MSLPAAPRVQRFEAPDPDAANHRVDYLGRAGNLLVIVSAADNWPGLDASAIFDGAGALLEMQPGFRVSSKRMIKLGEFEGAELIAQGQRAKLGVTREHSRLFVVKNRVVFITVAGPIDEVDDQDLRTFLDAIKPST